MIKEAHVRLNNMQKQRHNIIQFNKDTSITRVPIFQHRDNVGISCNKKVQLAKFYHKSEFIPSISTLTKATNGGQFATWNNLTTNIIQKSPQNNINKQRPLGSSLP